MAQRRQVVIENISDNIAYMRRLVFSSIPKTSPKEPTMTQIAVMFIIDNFPASGANEISKQFHISPSASTQLLNGLVSKKLIIRDTDNTDARKVRLNLTKSGKSYLKNMKKKHMKIFVKIFKSFTDKDLETMNRLQKKAIDGMKKSII